LLAFVDDIIFIVFLFDSNGFHKPLANFFSVAGVYIYMFAEEALGAVVGKPITRNKKPAIAAGEIFNGAFKLSV
jgi:hypothetical protein